ncbi:hypothetical protein VIGAN_08270500 [Vigna angularis var. angularis]|uniref:Uncharacterized protein n=1 Tax=Vigna angularis var. angularis TaxID=157739 RepID=A0A0S3SST0_PHAAN|nr:hypothetical protein VIGAN_08270500 [Vigna angularis var. angularis]
MLPTCCNCGEFASSAASPCSAGSAGRVKMLLPPLLLFNLFPCTPTKWNPVSSSSLGCGRGSVGLQWLHPLLIQHGCFAQNKLNCRAWAVWLESQKLSIVELSRDSSKSSTYGPFAKNNFPTRFVFCPLANF